MSGFVQTPSNVVTAALVLQFSIFIMVGVALAILPSSTRGYAFYRNEDPTNARSPTIFWVVFVCFTLTLGLLLFSDAFTSLWSGMYRIQHATSLAWSTSLLLVFLTDYVFIALLMWLTTGPQSPFQSLLLFLPALSIFLRQSSQRVLLYTILSSIIYAVFVLGYDRLNARESDFRWRLAQTWVNVATLCFGSWIGLIAQPVN